MKQFVMVYENGTLPTAINLHYVASVRDTGDGQFSIHFSKDFDSRTGMKIERAHCAELLKAIGMGGTKEGKKEK